MVGEGDLQCGVDAFGAVIAKEDAVQTSRCNICQSTRCFKRQRMADLEQRRVIHGRCLLLYCFGDPGMCMTCIDAPQARGAIQDLPAVIAGVIHAGCGDQHARLRLELAIGGERHPQMGSVQRLAHMPYFRKRVASILLRLLRARKLYADRAQVEVGCA
ncbi:hypothetical protein D3C81_1637710 [compost metagenome]